MSKPDLLTSVPHPRLIPIHQFRFSHGLIFTVIGNTIHPAARAQNLILNSSLCSYLSSNSLTSLMSSAFKIYLQSVRLSPPPGPPPRHMPSTCLPGLCSKHTTVDLFSPDGDDSTPSSFCIRITLVLWLGVLYHRAIDPVPVRRAAQCR